MRRPPVTKLLDKMPLIGTLSQAWAELRRTFADPYRPELHYMRGPGPKARAKADG